MLTLVVLVAFMSLWMEVFTTERLFTMLALERQEIDKMTMILRTLLANRQQLSIPLLVGRSRGSGHGEVDSSWASIR